MAIMRSYYVILLRHYTYYMIGDTPALLRYWSIYDDIYYAPRAAD